MGNPTPEQVREAVAYVVKIANHMGGVGLWHDEQAVRTVLAAAAAYADAPTKPDRAKLEAAAETVQRLIEQVRPVEDEERKALNRLVNAALRGCADGAERDAARYRALRDRQPAICIGCNETATRHGYTAIEVTLLLKGTDTPKFPPTLDALADALRQANE